MQPSVLALRVFVSSTLSDLKAERDALQEDVLPRLRDYCQKHGCRFQTIDLRFRLHSDREARRDCGGQGRADQRDGRVPERRHFRDTAI